MEIEGRILKCFIFKVFHSIFILTTHALILFFSLVVSYLVQFVFLWSCLLSYILNEDSFFNFYFLPLNPGHTCHEVMGLHFFSKVWVKFPYVFTRICLTLPWILKIFYCWFLRLISKVFYVVGYDIELCHTCLDTSDILLLVFHV